MEETQNISNGSRTPYWEVVSCMEWLWLLICAIFLILFGDAPLFSSAVLVIMTIWFKVIGAFFECLVARSSRMAISIVEISTITITCFLTQIVKEFAIGFDSVHQFFFEINTQEFQKGVDAGVVTNGEPTIQQATDNANFISQALSEAFMSPPFLTGESVVLFAILSYILTRGGAYFWHNR
ncbi:TPA: hypothetical protein ACPJ0G_004696 [Vibrio alginolyticus]|uniref:hypothetical protein n=1 Tax=Vibrio alginolyticus TaxID=663 RepID=UPI001A2C8533|nr:hypothetical protein [Vibrio alginolyticus]EGQ7649854.1 hypothetical protein [Vibrio alginolyticus]EJN8561723.1 hypothetical protein [Vibrio alginolyticus]ELB2891544.1 hypothetical protein [Vibrio alginolyticus]MBS9989693.1 hypothetical protein [Vibrio alginolyticus]MBT0077657.1 hypothetical protein [Vibrio alginolyticus]